MHFSDHFVSKGGHRAVAEALNEGGCDALLHVAAHYAPHAKAVCVPVFAFCRWDTQWRITSLASAEAFEQDAHNLITSHRLRNALLSHATADLARAHRALASASTVILRLVLVFPDESSHVNAVVVRGAHADLFEPRMCTEDTRSRPFATVRRAVQGMLAAHGIRLEDNAAPCRLQTDDDLCQTWVAAYVKECVSDPAASFQTICHRLQSPKGCDRLCTLLRFSESVYTTVPFRKSDRRGVRLQTLAERHATTSRCFSADPRSCRPPSRRSGVGGRACPIWAPNERPR